MGEEAQASGKRLTRDTHSPSITMTAALHEFTQEDDVTRPLPYALGPEKSVLSSMLKEPQEFIGLAIEEALTPAHFYLPAHATLFEFLLGLFERGEEIELISLVQKLLDKGLLDRVGGPAALTDLYTYACSDGHFRFHLQHVKDKFILRSIIQNSNEAIAQAYDAPDEVAELLDSVESKFMAIRSAGTAAREESNKDILNELLSDLQNMIEGRSNEAGLSTGFNGLYNLGARLKPGEMFVIAARPSMGKTALMMNIVEHISCNQGGRSMVFSLEMSRREILRRLLYSRSKFAVPQLSRGYTPIKADLQRIQRAAMEMIQAGIIIDDQPAITINELRAKARRRHREKPLSLLAIDYLQLMRSTSKQAQNSREREISEISAGVKGLAKELQVPIILLAQLNRGPESRTGKAHGKPRMSDLRESGSIEQDADAVGLLYREDYYAEDPIEKEACAGRSKLILDKNRNGETGQVPLTFIASLTRFEDGEPVHEQPELPAKSRHEID